MVSAWPSDGTSLMRSSMSATSGTPSSPISSRPCSVVDSSSASSLHDARSSGSLKRRSPPAWAHRNQLLLVSRPARSTRSSRPLSGSPLRLASGSSGGTRRRGSRRVCASVTLDVTDVRCAVLGWQRSGRCAPEPVGERLPARQLHAGVHVSVEDAELLIGRRSACGCRAAGDPGASVVERRLTNRSAGRVPHRSTVWVARVGDWQADRFKTGGGYAVEPPPFGDLDVDEVVL